MNEEHTPQVTNEQPVLSQQKDWKHHFTTVTPLSKFLAMLLFIALPFIGFWLGMNYTMISDSFNKPEIELPPLPPAEPTTQDTPNTQTEPLTQDMEGESPECFNGLPINSSYDTSTWEAFEADGFTFRYPSEQMYIDETDPNLYIDIDGFRQYTIHKYGHTAPLVEINVHTQYRPQYFVTRYLHASPVFYDWFSGTWWTGSGYVGHGSNYASCTPNSVASTVDGVPVYVVTDGDVGQGFYKYLIILKDVTAADGSTHIPQALEITARYDGNAPLEMQELYNEARAVVESILPTIQARGNLKG